MILVEEALKRVTAAFAQLTAEEIPVGEAAGRVLAENAIARATQPPLDVSSMDGYAVRTADVAGIPATLDVIGEAPAGHPFKGKVSAGQAVRVFTGAAVPDGADAIVIQENTERDSNRVTIGVAAEKGKHIRPAGLDFRVGDVLVARGKRLSARDAMLLAAGDLARVSVARKPRVAVIATGDELSRPGERRAEGGIVASANYGLRALIEKWGGVALDLGILPDRPEAFAAISNAAKDCDVVITIGGASVGEHDLIQSALKPHGFVTDFWKIAMRPGKPLIFGRLNKTPLIGLPGNPVSAVVCAVLFVRPAIDAMLGATAVQTMVRAKLVGPLPANGDRQDYIRARLIWCAGLAHAEPLPTQDSSMQRALADAGCLIVRAPQSHPAPAGAEVDVIPLEDC